MSDRKFKVGDRVRVVRLDDVSSDEESGLKVGMVCTVSETDSLIYVRVNHPDIHMGWHPMYPWQLELVGEEEGLPKQDVAPHTAETFVREFIGHFGAMGLDAHDSVAGGNLGKEVKWWIDKAKEILG